MVCPICNLDTITHRGRGCPRRKRKSGTKPERVITSFDCETTSAGIVLFLASPADRSRAEWIYDPNGLELGAVLDFLIRAGSGNRLNFGFYFDYDVLQIVRMLPAPHIAQLGAKGRVGIGQYQISHTPGKKFSVRRTDGKSVTIWDCSGWAACSFSKLCENWRLGTEAERAEVAAMKARRGSFEDATETELIRYTTLECSLLSDWVRTILELHERCEIPLRAYCGPGSTASAMVRKRGWKPPELPERIREIAEKAFFGGRSETSRIGPADGPIYGYDINSAYPAGIAELPELEGQRWRRAKTFVPGAWGFYQVRWSQPKNAVWGLFPMRGAVLPSGRRSVSLLYPRAGEGWFHNIEVETAREFGDVEILDGWVIEPDGRKPFGWVREEAETRLRYKAAGDERAYPMKVGLNSIYGKLAQHAGSAPLQCLAYAAAVTAGTRAALLRVAVPLGHDCLLLATDGILTKKPVSLPFGAGLGEWEREEYESAWFLQAGVYWAGRKKRTRGIDARSLELPAVEKIWTRSGTAGEVVLPSRRVMSYKQAIAWGRIEETGTWSESTRTVRLSPAPRRRAWRRDGDAMLTLPAFTRDYREQAELDALAIDMMDSDGGDVVPEWLID